MKHKTFFYIGSVLTIVVLSIIIFWIFIFVGNTNTFIENKSIFLNYFPKQIRNAYVLTLIQIVLSTLAIYLFIKVKGVVISKSKKVIVNIALFVNYLILIWLLFTML